MVCDGILTDKTMEKPLLKKRGKALLALGEVYAKVAKDAAKAQGKEDPAEFISKIASDKDKNKQREEKKPDLKKEEKKEDKKDDKKVNIEKKEAATASSSNPNSID